MINIKIYFVAGASGSGKTAVIPFLKKLLGSDISLYDFDNIGVPEGADKKWRQESTEKWLQKLLLEKRPACLLGQVVLGEIFACPSAKQLGKINFCLLDVSDFIRIERLKKRNTYGMNQNMLSWAAWLRMHSCDPSWEQHVIKDQAWQGLNFSDLDNLDSWEQKVNIKIIDTTLLSIERVANEVADWLQNYANNKLPCGIYRHYKGNYYEVIDRARDTETLEEVVVYRALYGKFELWVRPISTFLDNIEINGQYQKRFKFIGDNQQLINNLYQEKYYGHKK